MKNKLERLDEYLQQHTSRELWEFVIIILALIVAIFWLLLIISNIGDTNDKTVTQAVVVTFSRASN